MGEIEITEKGFYDLRLKINPKKDNPVNFQWIWLEISGRIIE
jgi:hypothetical protein